MMPTQFTFLCAVLAPYVLFIACAAPEAESDVGKAANIPYTQVLTMPLLGQAPAVPKIRMEAAYENRRLFELLTRDEWQMLDVPMRLVMNYAPAGNHVFSWPAVLPKHLSKVELWFTERKVYQQHLAKGLAPIGSSARSVGVTLADVDGCQGRSSFIAAFLLDRVFKIQGSTPEPSAAPRLLAELATQLFGPLQVALQAAPEAEKMLPAEVSEQSIITGVQASIDLFERVLQDSNVNFDPKVRQAFEQVKEEQKRTLQRLQRG